MKLTYEVKLDDARALGDGSRIHEQIADEYADGFYSFAPWWGRPENRTMIFLADVIQNKVFFYTRWGAYPRHFLTTKHDQQDVIAIFGDDPDYHSHGKYYIRLRPDFALFDLISDRRYIFDMYAFS